MCNKNIKNETKDKILNHCIGINKNTVIINKALEDPKYVKYLKEHNPGYILSIENENRTYREINNIFKELGDPLLVLFNEEVFHY